MDGEGEGYGSLFSIVLKQKDSAHVFYDRLDTAKGPGFGSNFSLVCPYPMIAHFNELQVSHANAVSASLARFKNAPRFRHVIATSTLRLLRH